MRLRQQCAADCDALTLAARQGVGPPWQQRADAQQLHHLVEPYRARRCAAHAEAQVGRDRHMREQSRVLEYQTDAASLRRQPDAGSGIGQHLAIDDDAAFVRPQQTRAGDNDGGFARTGWTEQHRDPWCGHLERHVHPHRGETVAQQNAQAHRPSMTFSRLPIHSDSSSPISARVSDTIDNSAAFDFAAWYLQRGVDRQRQGLRLARYVGSEGDDRAEFAEARRVGDDAADQNAGRRQRQCHVEQPVEPSGAQRARRLFQARIGGLQRETNGAHHHREGHHRAGQGWRPRW